jgi:hypothetical protein
MSFAASAARAGGARFAATETEPENTELSYDY